MSSVNAAASSSTHHAIPTRGLWLLAALALFWGANWPVMKMVLFEWNVWHFRAVCLILGSAGMFALVKIMNTPWRVPDGQWGRLIAASFFNITCWHIFSGFGVKLLASGRASIIGYTMPLWVVPLSMWFLKEPMTPRKWLGLILGFVGLILLIGDDLVRLQQAPLGTLMMLGAAVSWAIGIVIIKRYPVDLPASSFTGWIMVVGGIPIVVGAMIFGGTEFKPLSVKATIALAYVILVAMIFCHWAFMRLVTMLPATITGIGSLMVPVVGVFSGMVMLGEQPGAAEWGALAVILSALGVVLIPGKSVRVKVD